MLSITEFIMISFVIFHLIRKTTSVSETPLAIFLILPWNPTFSKNFKKFELSIQYILGFNRRGKNEKKILNPKLRMIRKTGTFTDNFMYLKSPLTTVRYKIFTEVY